MDTLGKTLITHLLSLALFTGLSDLSFAKSTIPNTQTITTWDGGRSLPDNRPAYLKPFRDPVFGYWITRVSDLQAFSKENLGGGKPSDKLRHYYATNAVWNSDSSKYMLNFGQVRDSKTNKLLLLVNNYTSLTEFIWSNTYPNIIYGTKGNAFIKFNIKTRKARTLHVFRGFKNIAFDNLKMFSEGDHYVVISDVRKGGKKVAVYDMQNDRIISQIDDIYAHPKITPGKQRIISGISPSGKYVVMIDLHGGAHVFDQHLNHLRQLTSRDEHADIGYDADHNEVLVMTCPATMFRLDTGESTDLLGKTYGCGHVSTRNQKQPGWAYFSLQNDHHDTAYGQPLSAEIIAVRLDKSGVNVRPLAHSRVTSPCPTDEESYSAMAVPNADGSKVIFNSSWGNPLGEIDAYIIDVPPLTK